MPDSGKAVRGAARLLLCAVAIAAAGCGTNAPSPAAARLRREDLIAVSRALQGTESSVLKEVAATRAAWPLVVNGLPTDALASARAPIAAALRSAEGIQTPALFEEAEARSLTGPAAQLAGLFHLFSTLAQRGWQLIGAAIDQIEHGSATSARFARENVALYIDSVYDGHFDLAQIGKHLRTGYRALGGPAAFEEALSGSEVDELADTYSEATDRLHPHVGVRLGS
jgi:hypothetical protein